MGVVNKSGRGREIFRARFARIYSNHPLQSPGYGPAGAHARIYTQSAFKGLRSQAKLMIMLSKFQTVLNVTDINFCHKTSVDPLII